jgi:hypothetical protein
LWNFRSRAAEFAIFKLARGWHGTTAQLTELFSAQHHDELKIILAEIRSRSLASHARVARSSSLF